MKWILVPLITGMIVATAFVLLTGRNKPEDEAEPSAPPPEPESPPAPED
jgi:hypothetical protein